MLLLTVVLLIEFRVVDRVHCFIFFVFHNTAGENLTFSFGHVLKFFVIPKIFLSLGTYITGAKVLCPLTHFVFLENQSVSSE